MIKAEEGEIPRDYTAPKSELLLQGGQKYQVTTDESCSRLCQRRGPGRCCLPGEPPLWKASYNPDLTDLLQRREKECDQGQTSHTTFRVRDNQRLRPGQFNETNGCVKKAARHSFPLSY